MNGQPTPIFELKRAIKAYFAELGAKVSFDEARSQPWASITFTGARHRLVATVSGSSAPSVCDAFADALEHRDFVLRGHILADIEIVGAQRTENEVRLTLEALTVDDR